MGVRVFGLQAASSLCSQTRRFHAVWICMNLRGGSEAGTRGTSSTGSAHDKQYPRPLTLASIGLPQSLHGRPKPVGDLDMDLSASMT